MFTVILSFNELDIYGIVVEVLRWGGIIIVSARLDPGPCTKLNQFAQIWNNWPVESL